MRWKPGRILWVTLAVIGLSAAGIALGLVPLNLFFAKDAIGNWLLENSGLQLEIEGHLQLRLGPRPRLTASGVRISYPETTNISLVTVEKLVVQAGIVKLLRGELDLRSLRGEGISQNLCPDEACPPGLFPERFELEAAARQGQPLFIEIKDDEASGDFRLSFRGDPLPELLEDPQDYPLEFEIDALSAHLSGAGTVSSPLSTPAFHGRLELEAKDGAILLTTIGLSPANQGPVKLRTSVDAAAAEIQLRELEGSLGDYQLRLDAMATNFSSRPRFDIDGTLNALDLGAFDEAPEPDTGDLDLAPYLDLLDRFDASLRFRTGEFQGLPLPVEELLLEATLDNGLLSISTADAFLAGSPVQASGRLDFRSDCPGLETTWQLMDFDLRQLETVLDTVENISAQARKVQVSQSSCGLTAKQHLRSLTAAAEVIELDVLVGADQTPLYIDSLRAEAAWYEQGHISFVSELNGHDLGGDLHFGTLHELLSGESLPFRLVLLGEASRLDLTGKAAFRNDLFLLESSAELSIERLGSLHGLIGVDSSNPLPLSARSQLALGHQGGSLQVIELRLGQSDLAGKVRWPGRDSEEPVSIDLSSSDLFLTELLSLFPESETVRSREQPEDTQERNPMPIPWPNLGRIDYEIDVARVTGLKHTISELYTSAQIRHRQVRGGRLAMKLDDIAIDGNLAVDFSDTPGSVAYDFHLDNVDIGALLASLELADGLQAHAESFDVEVDAEGSTLKELIQNLRMNSQVTSMNLDFSYGPENKLHNLMVDELQVVVRPDSQAIWRASGVLNGVPMGAYMESPSFAALFDRSRSLPLRLALGTSEEVALLDAVLHNREAGNRQIQFLLSGQQMEVYSTVLSTLQQPLREYVLSGEAFIGHTRVSLDDLDIRIGGSQAGGQVSLSYIEPRYLFKAELESAFLETDDLVQWVNDFREAEEVQSQLQGENVETNAGSRASEAGFAELISGQFDQIAERFDLDIDLKADELRSSGVLLGKAGLNAQSDRDSLLIRLNVDLEGADIDAEYSGRAAESGAEYALDLNIERLEYGGLLRLFNPESRAGGQVFVDASLRSEAPTAARMVENLQGHFNLMGFPQDVQAGFLDLWASNLVFALLPGGDDSDKQLNCLVTRLEVENGIMSSKNTFLDSTDVIVRARGDIDLVERKLDLWIAPQSKREKFLSVSTPLAVTGPFEDFSVDIAPGGFIMTVMRWYYNLIYVPWKWISGERFPADGTATCYNAMGWALPEEADQARGFQGHPRHSGGSHSGETGPVVAGTPDR